MKTLYWCEIPGFRLTPNVISNSYISPSFYDVISAYNHGKRLLKYKGKEGMDIRVYSKPETGIIEQIYIEDY